jgi:hypothetical protein
MAQISTSGSTGSIFGRMPTRSSYAFGRGYLRAGGIQGSPASGHRTDAFAAYEFCELREQPAFDLMPGPVASWKVILPSLAIVGELFRLAIVAEDLWGNPTRTDCRTTKVARIRITDAGRRALEG